MAFKRHLTGASNGLASRSTSGRPRRASAPAPATWRGWLAASLLALLLLVGAVWWWSSRPPPQLPDDPAVFKTTSALWTAIGSRDSRAVVACQQRLESYRQAQRLSPEAARRLERIIQRTQSGDWEMAARELYHFMFGQRRQGSSQSSAALAPSPGKAPRSGLKTSHQS